MNRAKQDSIASEVARRIFQGPSKKLWSFRDFSDLDSMPVAAALSRLSRAGKLRRVRRGIYYRPQPTAFGQSRPDPASVAAAVLGRRTSIPLHGYNRLGLTTQVSNDMVRAVEYPTRIKPVRGITMRTVTRPISRQKGINEDERLTLDALRNIRRIPDTNTPSTVKRIKTLVMNNRLNMERLARFARAEPPRVRALLGAIAEDLGQHGPAVEVLRQDLNPLTTYHIPGVSAALKNASNWRIK
jgi:hypothetical protein